MVTPETANTSAGTWAADNGCFNSPRTYSDERFLAFLDRRRDDRGRCLFAVAPDVVGNHAATLARALPMLPRIRAAGYPAAFVLQDGATPDDVPWGCCDWLFLGGTDPWRHSPAVDQLAAAAAARGVPLHVGRVNSLRRLRWAASLAARSSDGTFLARAPDHNIARVERWLAQLHTSPQLPGLAVAIEHWR